MRMTNRLITMYQLLAIIVGALTAIQSRLNGQLSAKLHNGIMAAVISFGSGLIILSIINMVSKSKRTGLKNVYTAVRTGKIKFWITIGGMGGGFFVAIQSITVPIIGVALFSIATIAGQTTSSLLVDKLGVSPRGKQPISFSRLLIAVATLMAVTISVYPDLSSSNFHFIPIVLGLIVGTVIAFQQATNGRVNEISQQPVATAWINFAMGTFVLIIALGINISSGARINTFPTQWWLYLGGLCGCVFIAVSAHVVKHLGVLNFVLFTVTGQLIAAVIIDWLFPTSTAKVSGYLIAGVLFTLFAIALSQINNAKGAKLLGVAK